MNVPLLYLCRQLQCFTLDYDIQPDFSNLNAEQAYHDHVKLVGGLT